MGWLSVASSIIHGLSYLLLPLKFLYQILVIVFAPIIHLGGYLLALSLFPLRLLAKFETVYIYLGIAALVGLVTGSILHLSSSALVSVLNLTPEPQEKGRSAASVRAARERRMLEDAWETSVLKKQSEAGDSSSSARKQAVWLDRGRRGGKEGLLRQTILEEDDTSEDEF